MATSSAESECLTPARTRMRLARAELKSEKVKVRTELGCVRKRISWNKHLGAECIENMVRLSGLESAPERFMVHRSIISALTYI